MSTEELLYNTEQVDKLTEKLRGLGQDSGAAPILLPSQIPPLIGITKRDYTSLKRHHASFQTCATLLEEKLESELAYEIMRNMNNPEYNHAQAKFLLETQFGWTAAPIVDDTAELTDHEKEVIENVNILLTDLRQQYNRDY